MDNIAPYKPYAGMNRNAVATFIVHVTPTTIELIFTPSIDAKGHIIWSCKNGEGLKQTQLPASCRNM